MLSSRTKSTSQRHTCGAHSRGNLLSVRAPADSGRQVEFPVSKEITFGRLDAASATFPDIDLTQDRGLEKGVSRRHAKITRKGSELFIEDLGSVNGTFLNGKRLTPYLPHALQDKDEIRLSRVAMQIHLHPRSN